MIKYNRFVDHLKKLQSGEEISKLQPELVQVLEGLDREQLNSVVAALVFNNRKSLEHKNTIKAIKEM